MTHTAALFITRAYVRFASRARGAAFVPFIAIAACGSDGASPSGPGTDAPKAVLVQHDQEVRRSRLLDLELRNTGAVSLKYRACIVAVERYVSNAWTSVSLPPQWAECNETVRTLAPGASGVARPAVPVSLVPGQYQVALYVTSATAADGAPPIIKFSNTFTVLP